MIAGAVAAAAVAGSASAQTITFVNGNYANPVGVNATIFEEFEGGAGSGQFTAAQGSGVRPYTISGQVLSAQGVIPGQQELPDAGNDKYLAIQAGGQFTVGLAPGVTVFSFVFGTLDTYNALQLFFSDGSSQTRTGAEIIGLPNTLTNPNTYNGVSGRVTYDVGSGPTITSATFRSTGFDAFEIDALSSAVPEPATWGLMILGFGMIGGQLRSRRNTKTTVSFA